MERRMDFPQKARRGLVIEVVTMLGSVGGGR